LCSFRPPHRAAKAERAAGYHPAQPDCTVRRADGGGSRGAGEPVPDTASDIGRVESDEHTHRSTGSGRRGMKKFAGLLLLLAVILVVAIIRRGRQGATGGGGGGGVGGDRAAPASLKGYIGGEKTNLLKDPDVVKILQEKYGLTVTSDRRGSLDMVEDPKAAQQDFLWPSSEVALAFYKESRKPLAAYEILLNSPIILYSWATVTDALIRQGVVQKIGGAYYVVDFPKLIKLVNEGTQWKDIGLPQLYGRINIYSTDPSLSNSGNMFAGLLANVLNSGQVVTDATLGHVLQTEKRFFDSQGFMEQSSDVIFRQFLNKGMGDKAIIVGYEAQLLEFSVEQGQNLSQRKEQVRMLYPRPTVWSSHPLLAINENGKRLIVALQDPDIQRIAWTRHG